HEVVRARAQDPPLTGNHEVTVRYIILAERKFSEVAMRIGTVLIIVWLAIGAIAGGQRHYYTSSDPNCGRASTIVVTVLAGPLNYAGLNPKVSCRSK
ncbi:MAG TPA: hypothetical protein VJ305_07805, partial [Streptosporangiaceae bacterium]|nr:hypothetical protein [Streptosporangiaceae bacterium]